MLEQQVNFQRSFIAKPSELKLIRSAVRKTLQESGVTADNISDVVLAIDEACQNIIRHAYKDKEEGAIDLNLKLSNNALTITLFDYADPVDPSCCEPKKCNKLTPGGLGNLFISKVVDSIGYQCPPPGVGNQLVMQKKISFNKE